MRKIYIGLILAILSQSANAVFLEALSSTNSGELLDRQRYAESGDTAYSFSESQDRDIGYSKAEARASEGNLGVYALADVDVYRHGVATYRQARSRARWGDRVTVKDEAGNLVTSGSVIFSFWMHGYTDTIATVGNGTDYMNWQMGMRSMGSESSVLSETTRSCGFLIDLIDMDEHSKCIDYEFSLGATGSINFMAMMAVEVNCHSGFGSCYQEADFFNSAYLLPTVYIDENANQISGTQFVSESGFDFAAGYQAPSTVPEPATWFLMSLGLAGLGFTSKRKYTI